MKQIPRGEFSSLGEYLDLLKERRVPFSTSSEPYLLGGMNVTTQGKTVTYDNAGNYAGRKLSKEIEP